MGLLSVKFSPDTCSNSYCATPSIFPVQHIYQLSSYSVNNVRDNNRPNWSTQIAPFQFIANQREPPSARLNWIHPSIWYRLPRNPGQTIKTRSMSKLCTLTNATWTHSHAWRDADSGMVNCFASREKFVPGQWDATLPSPHWHVVWCLSVALCLLLFCCIQVRCCFSPRTTPQLESFFPLHRRARPSSCDQYRVVPPSLFFPLFIPFAWKTSHHTNKIDGSSGGKHQARTKLKRTNHCWSIVWERKKMDKEWFLFTNTLGDETRKSMLQSPIRTMFC